MGEAKRRKQLIAAGKVRLPEVPLYADPSSPEGARALAESLSDWERDRLAQIAAGCRALSLETIRVARGRSNADEKVGTLATIHAGASLLLDHEISSFYSTPAGRPIRDAIACKKGCFFCCYMNVSASIVEAIVIADQLKADAAATEAVTRAAPRIDGMDPPARQAARVPCPLLRDGACSIYDMRPQSCRAYISFNAQQCEEDLNSTGGAGPAPGVTTFGLPRIIGMAITGGIRAACRDEGLQDCDVELTAALSLLLSDPSAVDRWLTGEVVFQPYG